MDNPLQTIIKDKQAFRKKLAAKPIAEKLWILESLSERTLALRPDSSVTAPDAPWPIPSGWRWSRMGDVATVIGGSTPRTDRPEYFGGDIPWITPADLSKYTEKTISYGARNISKAGLENSGARLLPAGAVLFSTRAPIGYVAIASIPVATNQGFKSFVLKEDVIADYAFYYLQHVRQLAIQMASGTTFLELSGKKAAQIPIPVPPLPEQHRIVAEIEKQFTRLEAGVSALKRVQANLKRYRAAVLKAACEGQLVPTEAELQKSGSGVSPLKQRRDGSATFETGEQLLKRILAERRKNWTGRGIYKEPGAPDTTGLPTLPDGWTWASVAQLLKEPLCNSISVKGSGAPPGVRALRLSAMSNSGFDYSDARFLPLSDADVDDLWIQEGDFFMSRGNGSLHLVGRGTYAQTPPQPTIFPDTMIRLRLTYATGTSGWIRSIWPSRIIRSQIESRVKTTAGIYKIAQPQVETIALPLPPLIEQTRIVAEVERRLSVIDELESVVLANLQRAGRLRQAVLQKAFTGALC